MADDTTILEEPIKPVNNRRKDGTFGANNNANPYGRTKGKTVKEMVRQHLDDNPKELKKFVEYFINKNRELAWRMMEGNPKTQLEVDVDKDTLGELTSFFREVAKQNDKKG